MSNIWSDVLNSFNVSLKKESDRLKKKDMNIKDSVELYFITSEEQIKQYSNEVLYEFEKQLRKWFKIKLQDPLWIKEGRAGNANRKYTMTQIVNEVLGREWKSNVDKKYVHIYRKVLAYYSSTISKYTYDRNTQKTKKLVGYQLSLKRIKTVLPYSLRLRYEEALQNKENIDDIDMSLPKDDLKAGHSRYRKTEIKRQKQRERGLKAYNDYISKKNSTK